MNKKQKLSVKKSVPFVIAIIVLLLVTYRTIIVPAKKTVASARLALQSAKEVYDLVKNQDIINAGKKLKETKNHLQNTKTNLKTLAWARFIPFWSSYYQDAEHLVNLAIHSVDVGEVMVEAIIPHAELLGLMGEGSFVLGSAEVRIEKAVQTMDKIIPVIDEVENKLLLIKKEVEPIDPNRYPAAIFGKKIHSQIVLAKKLIDQTCFVLLEGKPLVKSLPRLLGESESQRYLILYQNESQLLSSDQPTITSAIFRLKSGKPCPENLSYLYRLNQATIRDFATTRDFEKLFNYLRGITNIDGIIVIDGHAIVEIMTVLGPIDFGGTEFTTDLVPDCNCPQVIFELENRTSKQSGYTRSYQNNLFGNLMNTIIQKALGSSPRLYWGRLFKVINEEFDQKHILVYLGDQEAQKGIEALSQ